VPDDDGFETWLSVQQPCTSFGPCAALCCTDLARSPLGLCEDHEKLYRQAGRPGGARLPANWGRCLHGLNLGAAVPHQARHTLATKLLAAGASLQHIKRYLGTSPSA
jgi:hypothetical protein